MFQELMQKNDLILAECAVAERLRRHPDIELHPTLFNTPLIYGPGTAREAMASIYLEYLNVARDAGLPMLLTAPTWRLDATRIKDAGVPDTINTDAVNFLIELRDKNTSSENKVWVGALTGPRGDCYRPDQALETDEAESFHAPQIRELASTQADFLLAQTMPSTKEALGIAKAMAATNKPYIISFCTGLDGRVLDGMRLPEAMTMIDEAVERKPIGYFVNCTHPDFLTNNYKSGELQRLIGIQANGSSRDVTSLDGSDKTEADPVEAWAKSMERLHKEHRVPILGGCCGTSIEHLKVLSEISNASD